MITQEQIKELQKINEQLYEIKFNIDSDVRVIIREYLKIEQDRDKLGNNYISCWNLSENGDFIEGKWEETWRYGGYDCEMFCIPLEFFYNPQKLKDFRQEKIKEKKAKEELTHQKILQEEKDKLQKLATKYNYKLVAEET